MYVMLLPPSLTFGSALASEKADEDQKTSRNTVGHVDDDVLQTRALHGHEVFDVGT